MITFTEVQTYETLTNSQLLTLINNNKIKVSIFYLITDAINTDGGVFIQGVTTNSVSLEGSGIFLNADYQGVGDYSGVPSYSGNKLGIWRYSVSAVAVGDIVQWNNNNYVNLTGSWGSDPESDTTNWSLLPRNVTNGYIQEIDFVKYEPIKNVVNYRADKRGNVMVIGDTIPNYMLEFQWGSNVSYDNFIGVKCLLINKNFQGQVYGNILNNESELFTGIGGTGQVFYNNLDVASTITCNSSLQGIVYGNTLTNSSTIQFSVFNGSSQIAQNNLSTYSKINISGSIFDGNIYSNTLQAYSQLIVYIGITNTSVSYCNFSRSQYGFNSISQKLEKCSFDIGYYPNIFFNDISSSTTAKVINDNSSNFTLDIDLLGSGWYNSVTKTLSIPSFATSYGIFYLKNTGGKTIKNINFSGGVINPYPIKFIPNNGEIVYFEHTLVTSAVSGNLISDAGAFTNQLTGRTNGGDYIEYEYSGNLWIRTNILVAI